MRGVIGEDESDQKVNKDVFYILHNIENYFAKLGRNMLIDETNYKKSRRAFYINLAKKYNYDVNCVVFTTDLNTCLVRNANRERRVPVGIIEKHHNEFEPPAKEEGFDIIINSEDYVFAYEDLHKMFDEVYKFEESITDIIIKNFDDMV